MTWSVCISDSMFVQVLNTRNFLRSCRQIQQQEVIRIAMVCSLDPFPVRNFIKEHGQQYMTASKDALRKLAAQWEALPEQEFDFWEETRNNLRQEQHKQTWDAIRKAVQEDFRVQKTCVCRLFSLSWLSAVLVFRSICTVRRQCTRV